MLENFLYIVAGFFFVSALIYYVQVQKRLSTVKEMPNFDGGNAEKKGIADLLANSVVTEKAEPMKIESTKEIVDFDQEKVETTSEVTSTEEAKNEVKQDEPEVVSAMESEETEVMDFEPMMSDSVTTLETPVDNSVDTEANETSNALNQTNSEEEDEIWKF